MVFSFSLTNICKRLGQIIGAAWQGTTHPDLIFMTTFHGARDQSKIWLLFAVLTLQKGHEKDEGGGRERELAINWLTFQ